MDYGRGGGGGQGKGKRKEITPIAKNARQTRAVEAKVYDDTLWTVPMDGWGEGAMQSQKMIRFAAK